MIRFGEYMRAHQAAWMAGLGAGAAGDEGRLGCFVHREHLPLNFYPPIRNMLFRAPSGRMRRLVRAQDSRLFSALSPWVHLANMYLPFAGWEGLRLLGDFLRVHAVAELRWISAVSTGYVERERAYHPTNLLGERSHFGGRYLTVPDLGIRFVGERGRRGVLLMKSKFIETGFQACPGYTDNEPGLPINPDKNRCLMTGYLVAGKFSGCHLTEQGKRYAEYLLGDVDSQVYISLSRCPMSDCFSDLFRQQALARGLEGKYALSVSVVAVDSRNEDLANCGIADGLAPLPDGWRRLFPRLPFAWFTHDKWYEFVKERGQAGRWRAWLDYIGERYLYN